MKIMFVFMFFWAAAFAMYAQTPVPFPTENAAWCYAGYADQGQSLGFTCIEIDGNAVINGKSYTKSAFMNSPYGGQLITAYYREENRRLYILPENDTIEHLLYDFNLIVGDTFVADWGFGINPPTTFEVEYQDTLTTADGKLRKVLVLSGGQTWIEGIGDSDWTFLYPSYVISVSGGFFFSCFSENGKPVYPEWADSSSCGLVSIQVPQPLGDGISIFPNPVQADEPLQIVWQNENSKFLRIEILGLDGRVLRRETLRRETLQGFENLATSGLPNQFIVRVSDEKSTNSTLVLKF